MDFLKKVWPFSFGTKEVKELVIRAIVYVVVGAIFSALIGLLAKVQVVGVIFAIVGGLVDLYVFIGLVLLFLSHFKVLKD